MTNKPLTAAVLGALVMSVWMTATFAQGRNFTGNWMVDSERMPSGVQVRAGAAGYESAPPAPMPITLDATSFTVGPTKYKLDGTSSFEGPKGTVLVKASWKGDKLILEEGGPGGSGATIAWYLEGNALVRELSSPARDGGEPRVRKVYYKKSGDQGLTPGRP
jgi:hypothetical protein